MSTFDKTNKKVKEAAEKTEEEAKEAGGKIERGGKKGVEEARKVGHETKEKLKWLFIYSAISSLFILP